MLVAARAGLSGKQRPCSRRFTGGALAGWDPKQNVEPVIEASRGKVETTSARPLTAIDGYRAMFDLVPEQSTEPINIRLYLKSGKETLSETWIYQYTPPPVGERKLY